MTEKEYAEFIKKDASVIIIENDIKPVSAALAAFLSDPTEDIDLTYRIVNKEREFTWIRAKSRLIGEMDGCKVLMTSFMNTSGEAEDHIGLIDYSSGLLYVIEKNSYELLYANKPALKAWGVKNYCGKICYNYISGMSEPCPWCSVPMMKNGVVHVDETYSELLDKWFSIDCHEINWYGHDAIVIYASEITSQKKQQHLLEIDKSSLEIIIENIPLGVGVCKITKDVGADYKFNDA